MCGLQVEKVKYEVQLLSELQHKHIIKYYDNWMDGEDELVFITELASGSLQLYISKMHPVVPLMIRKWCHQILSALAYLHALLPPYVLFVFVEDECSHAHKLLCVLF